MVGANDGITADTLCVCLGCGQLTYGAQVCNPCAASMKRQAARAAAMFSRQPRVDADAQAARRRERILRNRARVAIIVVYSSLALAVGVWLCR